MPERPRRGVGNLPAELTSFVGRRRELGEAKRLLAAARLLTVTGAGGVGKTRLASRVAAEVRRGFADGVWLVELADLRDPQLLPNTVATAFDLRGTGDEAARLAEYLEDKQLLLVLDNCEHIADECTVLVEKLLASAGHLRVLATSRHALHTEGEHILHLDPLAVPPTEDGGEPFESVTLFVERAAAVLPGFELTAGNKAAVARICRKLEGIPLALELAAVRLRVLSVDQLEARLDDRFGLLTTGPRTARARQRTLEAAIDWSYGLCSPDEQRLWARLSVFPGGFDLDAAEHIGTGGPHDATLLDVLTGLVDKSVLSRTDGTFGWQAWYRMLETVREYATGKLAEEGGVPDVLARQAEYYVALARRYRAEGFGPRQLEWVGRLRREHANLRAALEYCLSTPDRVGVAVDIAASLWNFWFGGGLLREGYRYLCRGLDLYGEATMVRARALYAASFLAIQTGAGDTAADMLAELGALAEELDDERLRAGHAECTGMATFFAGDLPSGAELLERALHGYRAAGDALLVFDTLVLLAAVRFFLGDQRGAEAAAEALELSERHEARWSRGYALWAVAIHAWRADRCVEATNLLLEAIALRLADRTLLAFLIEALAWCQSSEGEHERAARLLGGAAAVWRLSGARVGEMSPYQGFDEQCATAARESLGESSYETAFAAGAGLSQDEVITYALAEKPARPTKRSRPAEPGGLTRRELEIAELVAQGMSNKDIAATLVIGRRTVETHVENILVKLGFTSRTQVASWHAGLKSP
jgi:predicted ATPase/DNA-binding CsgD family transcriptional regulator